MRRLLVIPCVSMVALLGFAIDDTKPRSLSAHEDAERRRLRAHFDSVLTELRQRDVEHLTVAQRDSRTRLTSWLAEYRDAGNFPLNPRSAGPATPFFRDSRGVLCAMAYLIDRSGRSDVVDRIARRRNNAYIRELADDRELVAWLDSAGLDVSEAARIQPGYIPDPPAQRRHVVDEDYAVASIALSGASLATFALNIAKPSRQSGAFGALAGAAAMLFGLAELGDDDTPTPGDRKVARVNVVAGGIALVAGIHRLRGGRRPANATVTQLRSEGWRPIVHATATPASDVTASDKRIGVGLQRRF